MWSCCSGRPCCTGIHLHVDLSVIEAERDKGTETARVHIVIQQIDRCMGRVIITMVNGNRQVTDLDEAAEDRCVCGGNN